MPTPQQSGRGENTLFATITSVLATTASVELSPTSPTRHFLNIKNDANSTLYILFAAGASAGSHTVELNPDGNYEMPIYAYSGIIHGSWSTTVALSGSAFITTIL